MPGVITKGVARNSAVPAKFLHRNAVPDIWKPAAITSSLERPPGPCQEPGGPGEVDDGHHHRQQHRLEAAAAKADRSRTPDTCQCSSKIDPPFQAFLSQ